jgi:multicomponent Na+:H+ antiporter subunit D
LNLPPFLWLILGALVLPFVPAKRRQGAFLVFPLGALATVWTLPEETVVAVSFVKYELILLQVDTLSRVFGIIFSFIVFAGGIYGWHLKDVAQQSTALLYGAGALGVTFSGDLFSLLIFWEIMAFASVWLVWARRTPEAAAAGNRYLLVHLAGGSLLLGGIAWQVIDTGSLALLAFSNATSPAAWLILLGVAINIALPPLHAWLPDAYPRATVTGAVFMSALSTKSAVYVLARLFPGWEILIWWGVIMALYGVVYAVLANDIRGILAYHIISQVGYMVCGVGIGTGLALNGTAAHAFSHILYKALLFMGAGVVLQTTGETRLSHLGGLARHMPWTVGLYMIGAFSISGFPFFNGFISKSMIVTAAGEAHFYGPKFLLILASVGTFLHTGLKLPYYTWFGRDAGLRPEPSPRNMQVGMGLLAFFCTLFGVAPGLLYQLLPFDTEYHPYTAGHLVEATQLLALTFVAFWIFRAKVAGEEKLPLDTDWLYRKPGKTLARNAVSAINVFFTRCDNISRRIVEAEAGVRTTSPNGHPE